MSKPRGSSSTPTHHDVITYNQHIVMNIDRDQRTLIDKYDEIIQALAERNMTAQEVHELYLDYRDAEFKLNIKTIYRYLNILKDAGIVAVAGYRITPGKRIYENIYSLSAKYYHLGEQVGDYWETGDARIYTDNMAALLSRILRIEKLGDMDNKQMLLNLMKYESIIAFLNVTEIYNQIEDDPKLEEFLPKDFFERQEFIESASKLLLYIRNFDNIRLFKDILDDIVI
ncbi:MAG: hypothetical protein ACXAE3_11345 [Candidatus Kariarchaeaceae archaeon]|jgi:DNA-binding transcriptional ArsR family regulator